MVATVAANIGEVNSDLMNQILSWNDFLLNSHICDDELDRKIQDYYSSKEVILSFKADFETCSPSDMNDALYYDHQEGVVNQCFGKIYSNNAF